MHATDKQNKTKNDLAAFSKSCEAIKKHITSLTKNQDFIIIIAGAQSDAEALEAKRDRILALPLGQDIYNSVKTFLKKEEHTKAAGNLICCLKKAQNTILGIPLKQNHVNIITLNTSFYTNQQDIKIELYSMLWKCLELQKQHKKQTADNSAKSDKNEPILLKPNFSDTQNIYLNMIGDAFCAALHEKEGNTNFITKLAQKRCLDSLEKPWKHNGRMQPYPIIYETTKLVYEDMHRIFDSKANIVDASIKIAEEVEASIQDENKILQWNAFIEPAQEIAYFDTDISRILGEAIYGSDVAYNRATAQIISTILKIDPMLKLEFEGYNPFSDTETQALRHKKECYQIFDFLQTKQGSIQTPSDYFDTAINNCELLLNGAPAGWCAPALIQLGEIVANEPRAKSEELYDIFKEKINELEWHLIRNLHRDLIFIKKKKKKISIDTIIDLLRQDDKTRDYAASIKILKSLTG